MTLALATAQALASPILADRVEAECLALPQADCPVVHHFGPGIYVREVLMPAGFVVGHRQRTEHLNVMLTGVVDMIDDVGNLKRLVAPLIFTAPPGRKVGFVLEPVRWQNIYATSETDIDTLEAMFLDKSPLWTESDKARHEWHSSLRQSDRDDFVSFLAEDGRTAEEVRATSIDDSDQIPMPDGSAPGFTVRPSPIEGLGAFLTIPAAEGQTLAPARLNGKRTPAGRFVNHSGNPNARFVKAQNGDVYLVAKRAIAGCVGGSQGEEITVDYRHSHEVSP